MKKQSDKITAIIATLRRAIFVKNEIITMLKAQKGVDNAARIADFERQIAAAKLQISDMQAALNAFEILRRAGVDVDVKSGVDRGKD